MRYIRHRRMINGNAGVKNGIFIPGGEKIWWSNGIREKSKKDPYNISEERRLSSQVVHSHRGMIVMSEFIGELLMIKVTPIGRRK
ncbi:hypothetical protein Tco_1054155 [Tanacetum coccineum]|uniref:Uncharacterized protein n=1 Tax=Tanacetum coccineum TaxID=301880 RepID=A0ABQ5GVY3_9ASTR